MPDAKTVRERFDQLKVERAVWEKTWQEVADHLLGRRDFSIQYAQPGRQRLGNIYDGTGMRSAQLFASAVASLLTNPATDWFNLTFADRALRDNQEFMLWLQDAEEAVRYAFQRPDAGFQPQMHESYTDLIGFGTGAIAALEDVVQGTYFVSRNLNEIFLEEDSRGRVDTVYRHFEMTARQVEQEYPGKSDAAIRAINSGRPNEKFKIINALYPNDERVRGDMGYRGLPIASLHVLCSDGPAVTLREGGFHEMPIMTPRWEKDSGEVYGRGPGINALPDQKMLNQMSKTLLKSGQKAVDPPVMVSDRGIFSNIRTHAGGVTVVRFDGSSQPPIQAIESRAQFNIGIELLKARQEDVEGAFHADILEVFRQPHMTATQVIEIANQVQRILAPVLGRQQNELLEPMVARVFGIEFRAGRLPVPPAGLENAIVKVEYQSPVARAQQASEKNALFEALGSVVQLAAAQPDVLDNFDLDGASRLIWELGGLPAQVVRDLREVEQIRKQRQAQMAAQQAFAMSMQAAETQAKMKNQAPAAEAA